MSMYCALDLRCLSPKVDWEMVVPLKRWNILECPHVTRAMPLRGVVESSLLLCLLFPGCEVSLWILSHAPAVMCCLISDIWP